MIGWMKRVMHSLTRSKRRPITRKRSRLAFDWLEDRTIPAASLAPPTLFDPIAPLRVDLASYSIRGELAAPAKNGTSIQVFQDSNANGKYDSGIDALAASAVVAKGAKNFSVSVNLKQDADNQFFVIATEGKLKSAPVASAKITEDSTAPAAASITRLDPASNNSSSVRFQVDFSEAVTGVDASDFRVVSSGSISTGAISVSGSGSSYLVTVNDVRGEGSLALSLLDDDSIRDILAVASQSHALGGIGLGNGAFTSPDAYDIDTIAAAVAGITRTGSAATTDSEVTFHVKFTETVTGVDASDFALVGAGIVDGSILEVTGSGTSYTVVVNPGSGSGSLRLDLFDNGTIVDRAGNTLSGTNSQDGTFTAGQSYYVLPQNVDSLATVVLPALHLDLLGLHIDTSEIVISLAATADNGKLLGNLLTTASNLINGKRRPTRLTRC